MRVVLLGIVMLVACQDEKPAPPLEVAPSSVVDAGTAKALLPPLLDRGWMTELVDPETHKSIAHVSIPDGARESRPIMVALHGAADRPEWACGEWRGVTTAYPFIVCPRGVGDSLLYWSTPEDTKKRITRAVEETKKAFGPYVRADAPMILAGFSMGANQIAAVARRDPATFPYLVVAEGAYDSTPTPAWSTEYARAGRRAIFLCTTVGFCEPSYRTAAKNLARHGVEARVNVAGTNAHGMWEDVLRSMRRDWPWFVSGAPGWESYAPFAGDHDLPGKTVIFSG